MAKVIYEAKHHNCCDEINEIDDPDLAEGSIVECSCGKQYIKLSTQFHGVCWEPLKKKDYRKPEPHTTYNAV